MRPKQLFHALLLTFTCGFSACPTSSELIRQYGYTEVRPPSQILSPGALVVVVNKEPFEARVICAPHASLGQRLHMMRSKTANSMLKKLNNKSFNLDVQSIVGAQQSEHLKTVSNLTMTLNNARIVELSDDDVLRGLHDRSPECAYAVEQRVKRGYTITMVSSALVADLTVQAEFSDNRGGHASYTDKALALQQLAVEFEGDVTSTASGEIRSQGLVWGIRDDEYLSALAIPYVAEQDFSRGTRHLPPAIDHKGGSIIKADGPEPAPATLPLPGIKIIDIDLGTEID